MINPKLRSTAPQVNVKVNGTALPADAHAAVFEVTVESSIQLPDACTIRIHDNDFKWMDSNHWKEGNAIFIEAGQGSNDPLHKVFDGEVVGLELDMAGIGVTTLTVRCLDKAHRLHRGKKRRTWLQKSDSDIVTDVAREAGLTCTVDNTPEIHEWVLQNNQTDWEFLQLLASRNGARVYLEDQNKLIFKKVTDVESSATKLEWGKELRSFRPRTSSGNQVDKVVVRGWDPKTKSSIVAQANVARGDSKISMRSSGSQTAKAAFGNSAEYVVVDRPVQSQQGAQEIAQSVMDEIGASFVEADGLCFNHPELTAGDTIEIKNIGDRFNGKYILSSVHHTLSAAEGFSTQFVISGKKPTGLMAVLGGSGGGKSDAQGGSNAGNIVIGLVTNNKDPEGLGRVKVKFPWLSEDHESNWARMSSPMAGNDRGFMFLPEIDDEVLVAFEHGDPNRAYVLGVLWNGRDKPPMTNDNAVPGSGVDHRRIKTRYGHVLDFEDTAGDGRIVLETPAGQRVVLRDGGSGGISVINSHGLEFFSDNNGQIGVVSPKGFGFSLDDVKMYATMYDQSGNYVTLTPGKLDISGVGIVNIKGGGTLNVSAPMVNINSGPAATQKEKPSPDTGKNKKAKHS